MPEEVSNGDEPDARAYQVRREGMSESMWTQWHADVAALSPGPHALVDCQRASKVDQGSASNIDQGFSPVFALRSSLIGSPRRGV